MNDFKLKETLGNLGLSENEISIYLSLLNVGSKTVNQIALKTDLPKSTVYDNIYKLCEKNLLIEDIGTKVKRYEAKNPIYLKTILHNLQTHHEASLQFLKGIVDDVDSAIHLLAEKIDLDSLENEILSISEKLNDERWDELKKILYKIELPALIVPLGNEFTNTLIEEVLLIFPEDSNIQILKLELLKHRGEFEEFTVLYKKVSEFPKAQIIYLEYLNIIGEEPEELFLSKIKSKIFAKDTDKDLLHRFQVAFVEYLWIHKNIELAIEEAKKLIHQGKDPKVVAKLQFLLGEFYRHRGKYKKAIALYEESLSTLEFTFEKRWIALLYKSMSVCFRNIDKWTKSFEYVTKAVKVSKEFGDKSLIARTVLSLGSFMEIRKNNLEALKLHQEAFSLGKGMGTMRDIFYAGQNIAITLLKLHRFEEASEYFEEAYPSAEKLKRSYYFNMWIGFLKIMIHDNYKEGFKLINESIETARERNEEKRIEIAHSLLGSAYFIKGIDTNKGLAILQKLSKSTTSNVIRIGIEEVLNGMSFWDSRLCS